MTQEAERLAAEAVSLAKQYHALAQEYLDADRPADAELNRLYVDAENAIRVAKICDADDHPDLLQAIDLLHM